MQRQLDGVLEAVRERPGTSLIMSCAGAILVGCLAGSYLRGAYWLSKEEDDEQLADNQPIQRASRETTCSIPDSIGRRITDESSTSGASTPQSSINGTPRRSLASELSGELDVILAIVVRADLQIPKGRLATLSAQAAIAQYKQLHSTKSTDLRLWEKGSKSKICLQCPDERRLLDLQDAANRAGVKTFKVKDQIEGQRQSAVLAIGPAKGAVLKELTHSLLLQP